MKILIYNELEPEKISGFKKVRAFIEADDFHSAEVKKVGPNLYRARLDKRNRILFSIYHYNGDTYALILEYIANHAYEKSRFLKRGAEINEDKIPVIADLTKIEKEPLRYINPKLRSFNVLDKVLSFDDIQNEIYSIIPPFIIIGSAGSGKTALALEKIKETSGDILYVTKSLFLAKHSRNLYYANNYSNENQEIAFLSFEEFLESIHVPSEKEMDFYTFNEWFCRHSYGSKIKNPHKLFEEFRGVLTGAVTNKSRLDRNDYIALGVRQSIFTKTERGNVYDIFEKYLLFLKEGGYYDPNILSFEYQSLCVPQYDFIAVDEIQDITNVQLSLILKTLRFSNSFILCGDSNQIVHPNFFSWAKVKTHFYNKKTSLVPDYNQRNPAAPDKLIFILNSNYRNSRQITAAANRILRLKNSRFGSIDRESHYLVESTSEEPGKFSLLPCNNKLIEDLNSKTRYSKNFAVIVLYAEQKARAREHFKTPLIFSIQEAKGLEYENIILFNFISSEDEKFREICRGVTLDKIDSEMKYARVKDKEDKSLEVYKFFINSFYVAVTRAIKNIYVIESKIKHQFFELLQIKNIEEMITLEDQKSSKEEWQREARKLELQGKKEQACQIRSTILRQQSVPWEVIDPDRIDGLKAKAFDENNKEARMLLFEYALVYNDRPLINKFRKMEFKPALRINKSYKIVQSKYFEDYDFRNIDHVVRLVDKYGVNFRNQFNFTPLMISAQTGHTALVKKLYTLGADPELINNNGFNAFQLALERACDVTNYAGDRLASVYKLIEPDSIAIQVDNHLIKLDNHQMEFFLLNILISIFYTKFAELIEIDEYVTAGLLVRLLDHFSEEVLPARRKKRSYITSILSKNEIGRNDKYNRKLFRRVRRGSYIINPELSIRISNKWYKIYELLNFHESET